MSAFEINGTIDIETQNAITSLEQINDAGDSIGSSLDEIDGKELDVNGDEANESLGEVQVETDNTGGAFDNMGILGKASLAGIATASAKLAADFIADTHSMRVEAENFGKDIDLVTGQINEYSGSVDYLTGYLDTSQVSQTSLNDSLLILKRDYELTNEEVLTLTETMAENNDIFGLSIDTQELVIDKMLQQGKTIDEINDLLGVSGLLNEQLSTDLGEVASQYFKNKKELDDHNISFMDLLGSLNDTSGSFDTTKAAMLNFKNEVISGDESLESWTDSNRDAKRSMDDVLDGLPATADEMRNFREEVTPTGTFMEELWVTIGDNKALNELGRSLGLNGLALTDFRDAVGLAEEGQDDFLRQMLKNIDEGYEPTRQESKELRIEMMDTQKELKESTKDIENQTDALNDLAQASNNAASAVDSLGNSNANANLGANGIGSTSNSSASFTYNNYFSNVSPTSNNLRNIYLGQKGVS